jgi:Tfp pilus assembly protein PilF
VAEYRLALADVYEKRGKPGDALVQYEKALGLSPTNQHAKSKMIEYYKKR